jgi:hypothetical protein
MEELLGEAAESSGDDVGGKLEHFDGIVWDLDHCATILGNVLLVEVLILNWFI